MNKRILSLLLVLAMVLTGIPAVFARETGMVVDPVAAPEVEETTDGPLSLPVDNDVDAVVEDGESGIAPNLATEGTTKFESAYTPFSQQIEDTGFSATDKVTFIVEMNGAPLLANFSKEDITAQTAAVTSYQDKQMVNINSLKNNLTDAFAEEEEFEIGFTYTLATTGVSVTTEYGNKAAIEAMPGVANVYVAPVFELPEETVSKTDDLFYPTTSNATQMIGANLLNESGYTGKGMRIAILDTGLWLEHPNFAALPEDKLENPLTVDEIKGVWEKLNASQSSQLPISAYYSTKIPYIFNYSSLDTNVDHSYAQHDHGTHVAGIAAANKIESSPVIGVAPDAQILVMQVFQHGGGASFDQIMAALEDCVHLDVDSVNLSLGSAAGFTDDNADSAINKVMKLFMDTGIEVLIASGNDTNNAYMNNFGLNMSLTSNPDIGLAGTPSTYKAALAVASIQNDAAKMLYFTIGDRKIGYDDTGSVANTTFITQFKGKTLEYVLVPNGGAPADYEGLNVEGKVAVVSRGYEVSFPEKQANAKEAGAVACIVYNNQPGVIHMQINNEADDIPCIAVSKADGEYLVGKGNGTLTVCNGDMMDVKMARELSGFSSWGSTPDLKLKPEIAGVGGQVYSTTDPQISGTQYATWDGTSMATPQVAGAAAVILEYFQENHPELKGGELRRAVANVMMSTAQVIMNGEIEYSPRGQGSGLVDMVAATTTKGYLTSRNVTEDRPKGEMGDDPQRTGVYTFGFEINNISDKELTYNLDSTVMSERIHDAGNAEFIENVGYKLESKATFHPTTIGDGYKYDFNKDGKITTADARALLLHVNEIQVLDSQYTDVDGNGTTDKADVELMLDFFAEKNVDVDLEEGGEIVSDEAVTSVTVPAGEKVILTAKIELTEADKAYVERFPNGIYVEGFVYADDTAENGVDLHMPFLGFYGDWSDAPVFDDPDPNKASLFPRMMFTMHSLVGQNPYILGGKGGDDYNAFSYSNPLAELDFGQLRNAKRMTFTVTDKATGAEYFNIEGKMMGKSYFNAGAGQIIPAFLSNGPQGNELWDGKDPEGNVLPDGTKVTYTATAYLDDGDDVADDSFSMDLVLDSKFPSIENESSLQEGLTYKDNRTYLKLDMLDNQHIAAVIFAAPNGKIMGKYAVDNVPGEVYTKEYDITGFGNEFSIIVADYACNEREIDVTLNLGEHNNDLPTPVELSKDRLYGCETFDQAAVEAGWFSVGRSDYAEPKNETFDASNRYYSAEYVNGYLVAQSAVTGNLELVTPGGTYWSTLTLWENQKQGQDGCKVLYDMAMDYSGKTAKIYNAESGKKDVLFGVGWSYKGDQDQNGKDDGYNALFRVVFNDWGSVTVEECGRITGVEGEILTLGITTEGEIYGINSTGVLNKINPEPKEDEKLGQVIECTPIGTTDFVNAPNFSGLNVIQSMGYDHNTKQMYWYAHSQTPVNNRYVNVCMTYIVDLTNGKCTEVGTYGPSGQTSLFVPHDIKSDLFEMGVQATDLVLRPQSMLMVEGQTVKIKTEWNPWNAKPSEVTWTSSDEECATVDEYGFVTAKKSGEVTITATAQIKSGEGEATESAKTCEIQVLPSEDELYSFIIADYKDQTAVNKWVTYSDKTPMSVTNLGGQKITIKDPEGKDQEVDAMWYGGAYYNGYVYTVTKIQKNEDGVISEGMNLYRSKVTKGETPDKTTFGKPEYIGFAENVEIINIAFDYNTSRMYAVDAKRGGLGLLDIETGEYDYLGDFNGDCGGPIVATAMTITKDGTIVIADMQSALYTVDPDTMHTTKIYDGAADSWYYAAMSYDYNTDSIYWNPCMMAKSSPLNLVRLVDDEYEVGKKRAIVMDIGDVSTKSGVEQTVMFAIPDEEPEAKQVPVKSIKITNGDKIQGLIGGSMQLNTETEPARPSVRTRTWESDNTDVVTVDKFGVATFVGEGTATITVSITNKDPGTHGGPFTDTIKVEVYEAAGDMVAFLGSDENGSNYYDFWLSMKDYDLGHATIRESMISIYSLRTGIYYDGYYYATTHTNNLIRIDGKDRGVYSIIGNIGSTDNMDKVLSGMALDYTTGTVYGVTISGKLVTVDLNTAEIKEVAELDQKVFTIAVDKNGTLYGAGSKDSNSNGFLYTIDKKTGACTKMMDLPCKVFTGDVYLGYEVQYNPQLAYDFGTNRLYLNSGSCTKLLRYYDGMYMIQLGKENPAPVKLGGVALQLRGTPVQGKAFLGLMTFIPKEDVKLPVHEVNGLIMAKNFGRVCVGESTKLDISVRPSNAADTSLTWKSDNEAVATVDKEGNVTGVSAGTATITAMSNQHNEVTATCQITVVEKPTTESVAYSAVVGQNAMYKFNPALPAQTAEKIGSVEGKITGVTYGKDCLYVMVANGGANKLHSYDLTTNTLKYITDVEAFFELNGIAYDEKNNLLYGVGGFYVFQYDLSKAETSNGFLRYSGFVMDSDATTMNSVAVVDEEIYCVGTNMSATATVMVKFDMSLNHRTVITRDLGLTTMAGKSEMAYDSSINKFYISDVTDSLYTMDVPTDEGAEIKFTPVDKLGGNLVFSGLAIKAASAE